MIYLFSLVRSFFERGGVSLSVLRGEVRSAFYFFSFAAPLSPSSYSWLFDTRWQSPRHGESLGSSILDSAQMPSAVTDCEILGIQHSESIQLPCGGTTPRCGPPSILENPTRSPVLCRALPARRSWCCGRRVAFSCALSQPWHSPHRCVECRCPSRRASRAECSATGTHSPLVSFFPSVGLCPFEVMNFARSSLTDYQQGGVVTGRVITATDI